MKRILIWLLMVLTLAGCTPKELTGSYDKMQVSDKGIKGYYLDLRIYGSFSNKSINEIIRIENYNSKEYKVTIRNVTNTSDINKQNQVYYLKDRKVYKLDENNNYVKSNDKIKYTNPNSFLEGLKNIKSSQYVGTKKIGSNAYRIYTVTYNASTIKSILIHTDLANIKVKKDVPGEVYIDKNGYAYRIIYNIEGITINANYYGINQVKKINITPVN